MVYPTHWSNASSLIISNYIYCTLFHLRIKTYAAFCYDYLCWPFIVFPLLFFLCHPMGLGCREISRNQVWSKRLTPAQACSLEPDDITGEAQSCAPSHGCPPDPKKKLHEQPGIYFQPENWKYPEELWFETWLWSLDIFFQYGFLGLVVRGRILEIRWAGFHLA